MSTQQKILQFSPRNTGLTFKFPLKVLDDRAYAQFLELTDLQAINLENDTEIEKLNESISAFETLLETRELTASEKEQLEKAKTAKNRMSLQLYAKYTDIYKPVITQFIMEDCIDFYLQSGNVQTKEGQFVQELLQKTNYTVFSKEETLKAFKKICFLGLQEFEEISGYYLSYINESTRQVEQLTVKYDKARKNLEKDIMVSSEVREARRIELANEQEAEVGKLKLDLYNKYFADEKE